MLNRETDEVEVLQTAFCGTHGMKSKSISRACYNVDKEAIESENYSTIKAKEMTPEMMEEHRKA